MEKCDLKQTEKLKLIAVDRYVRYIKIPTQGTKSTQLQGKTKIFLDQMTGYGTLGESE